MSYGSCERCVIVDVRQPCNDELVCQRCFDTWCEGYAAAFEDWAAREPEDGIDTACYPTTVDYASEVASGRKPESTMVARVYAQLSDESARSAIDSMPALPSEEVRNE